MTDVVNDRRHSEDDAKRGASMAERVRFERLAGVSDRALDAVATNGALPASEADRRAAAAHLAARQSARRRALDAMDDVALAKLAIDRGHVDQVAALDALARRAGGPPRRRD